jgi:class 3 adenylate cyclase
MVAVMNNSIWCKEVNIVGDCVSGIFDTPSSTDIDAVFGTAASLSSIIDALNSRLNRFNISTIEVGIGIDYGRALMIKAGYKGSGINDVVWMGDVVNKASHLSGLGSKTFIPAYQYWQEKYGRIVVSPTIYNNLNDHNRGLLKFNNNVYHGNIVNTVLDNAIKALSI